MLQVLINLGNVISPIFYRVLYMSIIGTILGVLLLIITKLFDNKVSAKWKCFMWIIPLIFLMIPIQRIEIKTHNNIPMISAVDKVEDIFINIEPMEYDTIEIQDQELSNEKKEQLQENIKYTDKKQNIGDIILHSIIPTLWLSGCIIWITIFIISNIGLIGKIRKTKKLKDYRIKSIQRNCKRKLGINKKIEIRIQEKQSSPCIYGIISPKILVPENFENKEDEIIENVFMHELSHYKRKDMITNLILLIMTAVHWFNPFIYGFFRKMRQEMELATDETALSKMDKDEKKKYGFTLINLLQTYQCEEIGTKMLCITDDSKNMEKRIRMIKLSTKLRKYKLSVIVFIMIFISCATSPFLLKTTIGINNQDVEENLYDKVEQYFIKDEESLYNMVEQYLVKNEESNKNGDNFKVFINMEKLGIINNSDETDVYVWAIIRCCYILKGEVVKRESSMPYKVVFRDNQIIYCQKPESNEDYSKSVEDIFPEYIREKMKDIDESINSQELEKKMQQYYGELNSVNANLNENVENEIDLEGKWILCSAKRDNENISLNEIYGSSIYMYQGSLNFDSMQGTYTKYIGIYSEEDVSELQGNYKIYKNTICLNANSGMSKKLQYIDSKSGTFLKEYLDDGIEVYYKKVNTSELDKIENVCIN